MRYLETKEKSAELLRLALAQMGQHDAAFNPFTFTLWYEHVAGMNPRLSQALAHVLQSEPRLGNDTVHKLYREHIADMDEAAAERINTDFQRVMQRMAESAAQTGSTAGNFGDQLSILSQALQGSDSQALSPQLSSALAGTAQMKQSLQALQDQVSQSQQEIDRLRTDLRRTREDALLCPLTRVLNRRGFDQKLDSLLSHVPPDGTEHCLIMLDIDHFKKVNDTHGHLMGDRVIQALGEILRGTVVDPGTASARYGGEEFAILLPSSSVAKGQQLAESVRTRTKAMKVRNRTTQEVLLTVTVSAGVATMQKGDDASSLIARADAALYQSKQSGRDRVTVA